MKMPLNWAKEFAKFDCTPREYAERMTMSGSKVETYESEADSIKNVIVGKVLSIVPHPDSDHMVITQIDIGQGEPVQIVTGANNLKVGDLVPAALHKSLLPGGKEIRKGKLRGVESNGMLCSLSELGLTINDFPNAVEDGILVLDEEVAPGTPAVQALGMDDVSVEFEITPNRPDCLAMVGIAREVGAIYDRDYHVDYPQIKEEKGTPTADELTVAFDGEGMCDRYVARIVRNVKVGPSPDWMVQRLTALGIRPHNNIVDITNYVMMLTGQPLHAFDLSTFAARDGKRSVVVRAAQEGETFTTLDGVERTLSAGMTLITDGERPVALAGVMGGMDSEIEDDTVDVMVESACFDAGRTSHTSRDLSLISDASIRFERQVDETGCVDVANITCALIEELAGGEVAPGYVDLYPAPKQQPELTLRLSRVHAICGADIEADFVERALTRLGCTVSRADGDTFHVVTPSFRPDLPREIDLIEEILRLWGMDRVEATIPAAKNHIGGLTRDQHLTRKIGQILRACGLNETTTFGFAAADDLKKIGMSGEGRGCPVVLMDPLIADQTEMRRSLIPGLLRSVAYNEAHGTANVQLYEIGRLFHGRENASKPKERMSLAGVLSGAMDDITWLQKYRPLRFFDGKGVVEELLAQLRIEKVRFRPAEGEGYAFLQPGRGAEVLSGGTVLGWVGEIHPDAREAMDIDLPVVAFELNFDALLSGARNQEAYHEFSSFPSVEHDLAIVVDESVTCEDLERRITSAGGKLLAGVRLFDVYRDPVRVGEGKKSMAFALTYRSDDHTLTSEEVEKAHSKLVTKVCKATGGEVRA